MHTLSSDVSSPAPVSYAAVLRRRWPLVLAFVLLGLGAALASTLSQPASYRSTATVLVQPTGIIERVGGPAASTEVDLDTELQLLRSVFVAERARALLGTRTDAAQLRRGLRAMVAPNTRVIDVSFMASRQEDAQRGASAFAQAYLDARSADARGRLEQQVDTLKAETDALLLDLQAVSARLATVPAGSPDSAFAEAQRSVLVNQISNLQSRATPLRSANTSSGSIVDDAPPGRPQRTRTGVVLVSGLLGGLLLGLVAALVSHKLSRRLRGRSDVEDHLGLTVLAELPAKDRSLRLTDTSTGSGRAFGELRNVVVKRLPGDRNAVIVTSAADGAGAGLVSANLADGLARAGYDVVLLVADNASPAGALVGVVPTDPGLCEVLRDGVSIERVLKVAPSSGLRVLLPGAGLDEHVEQLASSTMAKLVSQLRSTCDYLVIDAPSAGTSADAQSLARLADTALLVVERQRATRHDVRRACEQLERMDVPVEGVVVVPKLSGAAVPPPGAPARALMSKAEVRVDRRSLPESFSDAPRTG